MPGRYLETCATEFRQVETTSPWLWVLAFAFFGVGDLATTTHGLSTGVLVEIGPLAAPIVERFGLVALVALKAGAFAVCFAIWRQLSNPAAVFVPLWLSGFGVVVTGWNVSMLLLVSFN